MNSEAKAGGEQCHLGGWFSRETLKNTCPQTHIDNDSAACLGLSEGMHEAMWGGRG